MSLKMYCVFSKESIKALGGNRGKLAAQAGHAYLHAYWDSNLRFLEPAVNYRESDHAYKICLVVDTNEQLEALYNEYKDLAGSTRVVDSAFTVLRIPMLTCIGIGPVDTEQNPGTLNSLKVLI